MANLPTSSAPDFIFGAIKEQIEKEAARIYEDEIRHAVTRLKERMEFERERTIAAIAVKVSRTFDVRTMGDQVILTIETRNINTKELK